MADPNAMVFMCAVPRLRGRSRSPLHMKKRSCAATRAFPRLQAGAGPTALCLRQRKRWLIHTVRAAGACAGIAPIFLESI